MRELADRLQQDKVYAQADALRQAGDNTAATALLNQQPASPRRDLTLADWALADGYPQQALEGYQRLLAQDKQNPDAALGQIDALVALNRKDEARAALNALPAGSGEASLNVGRPANARQSVDDTTRARRLYQQQAARGRKRRRRAARWYFATPHGWRRSSSRRWRSWITAGRWSPAVLRRRCLPITPALPA